VEIGRELEAFDLFVECLILHSLFLP
jgi:hypothetical protein